MSESAFELTGPLPRGVTVLEASAGTGKTFTIAALAARFVAEGHALEELLLVTFTRMATGELRERVRERFVTTERELSRVLAGAGILGCGVLARVLSRRDEGVLEAARVLHDDGAVGARVAHPTTAGAFRERAEPLEHAAGAEQPRREGEGEDG